MKNKRLFLTKKELIRKNIIVCSHTKQGDCADATIQKILPYDNCYLGFVEFDDQGQLLKREQLNFVINTYQDLISSGNGAIIVAFVHGWHHGAKSGDGNIESFRHLLSDISEREKITNKEKARKVLGVYLAWRGDSLDSDLINWGTFWERKNTAHEIGANGLPEALIKLEGLDSSPTQVLKNRLIVIGHSFGGAIVFSALNNILIDRYYATDKPSQNASIRGFGDLVVLLNPAFEAMRFATLYNIGQGIAQKNGKEICRDYSAFGGQPPRLVILTSEADTATKYFFPSGRVFSTVFETHKELEKINCTKTDSGDYLPQTELIKEGEADRTAIGHFEPFITHTLKNIPDKKQSNGIFFHSIKRWLEQNFNGELILEKVALAHLGKTHPLNPYLNIRVDKEIISDHNAIWVDEVRDFIGDLILISTNK